MIDNKLTCEIISSVSNIRNENTEMSIFKRIINFPAILSFPQSLVLFKKTKKLYFN